MYSRKIAVSIVIFCLLSVSIFGSVSNYSFRIKGMGSSVLDFTHDAYSDVFYNPAYISNIDGLQIYTNLSNLGSVVPLSVLGNEISFIKNSIYPSNLVGFMGRWKFLSGGAFYVSEGYNFKVETKDNYESEYSWEEGNTTHTEKDLNNYNSTSDFTFGGRQLIGVGTVNLFGIKLGIMGKLKTFNCSYGFESVDKSKDYDDGELTYNRTSEDKYSFNSGLTFLGLTAGTIIGGENTELSLSGGFEPGGLSVSSEFFDEWIRKPYYQGSYYYYQDDDEDYWDQEQDDFRYNLDKQNLSYSIIGSEVFGNVRLRKKVKSSTNLSMFGRVSTSYFPIDIENESADKYERSKPNYYNWYENYQVYDTTYGDYYLDSETYKKNGSGNLNFFQIKAGIGIEHKFENGALFILGAKGNYLHIGNKIELESGERTHIYKDLENNPNYQDYGYIRTINYNNSVTMKGSGNLLFIEVPSALEFDLFKKLAFRVGSNQIIPIYGNGKYEIAAKDKPNTTKIEYTDGPDAGTTETITDQEEGNDEEYTEIKISTTNLNLSSYYTGLGYKVNENISIDIIHYTKLTDLGTWYLSFTINL